MTSTATPLAFACEADEKAYARLMKWVNNKANRLDIPGFSFAGPGAHAYPAGIFSAVLQLIHAAPTARKFKAAKALVAEAGLARVERTGAGDRVVHREDVLQAIVAILAGDEFFTQQPRDGSAAGAAAEKGVTETTRAAGAARADDVVVAVSVVDLETFHMDINVPGFRSIIKRELDKRFRFYLDRIRQYKSERDSAVAAQAIMGAVVHKIDGERKALDKLVDEMQKERNEWRDIAIERNGDVAAVTKEREECRGLVKDLKKLLGEKNKHLADKNKRLDDKDKQLADKNTQLADTNKMLEDKKKKMVDNMQKHLDDMDKYLDDMAKQFDNMAKQFDDMEKQRGCWRDIANVMQRQRDDWQDRAGDMKAERDNKQKERVEWEQYARYMKAQRDCLRCEVEELKVYKDKYSALKKDTKEYEQETKRLRKDLQGRDTQCNGLAMEVKALKQERDSDESPRRKLPKLTDSCLY